MQVVWKDSFDVDGSSPEPILTFPNNGKYWDGGTLNAVQDKMKEYYVLNWDQEVAMRDIL